MNKPVRTFSGSLVALVTPFTPAGGVDFDMLDRLVDFHLQNGTDGIVALGTTAETPTMTDDEKTAVASRVIERVGGSIPVIVGAGSNNTAHAAALAQHYEKLGADGLLVVTPYYNKANKSGMLAHFRTIADGVNIPILLYNVPSRTGCNLQPATCAALGKHPRIAAVKEASGNIGQIVEVAALAGDCLAIYSGNDDHIVPVLSMGGSGCISVLSNVVPREAQTLCDRFFAGDVAGAAALQCQLLPLVNALFSEVNPIPVNAALAAMGFGKGGVRLPLTPMEDSRRTVLLEEMKRLGVLA